MKNPLQEILNASTTMRASSTLDPKEAMLLPPLLEQRSSLLAGRPLNKATSKRPMPTNNSEPKLRKEHHDMVNIPSHGTFDVPSEDCVDKLIRMILEKGKRSTDFLNSNGINTEEFIS